MTTRKLFLPAVDRFPFVREVEIEFEWFPGFAISQARKSIAAMHAAAARQGLDPTLEISSKSDNPLGVALSAFNLHLRVAGQQPMPVECAFQGSKVFASGGPFTDLYAAGSKAAKTDERLRASGELVGFRLFDEAFPLTPPTAFYDWLYIRALRQNLELANPLLNYRSFSDIAFNSAKSINCQARSAALYVALSAMPRIDLDRLANDKAHYLHIVTTENLRVDDRNTEPTQLRLRW